MAKLFVSYSRRDSMAARKLIEAFRSIDQDVWVDWESIPPAVDWLEQIFRGIEESDAFIFLISPDSIASEVCKVELARAALNNKRIIPIVLRDVHPKETPESISKLNWTFMRETDSFEEGLAKVKTAIDLDLDWLEEHRRLQVRALEWHRRKDTSLLLHGKDLRNARHMVETATSKDPTPTDLQKTYIQHSLRAERNRRFALLATGIAVMIMAVLLVVAINESRRAVANETRALQNEKAARDNEALAERKAIEAEEARQQEQIQRQEAENQRQLALQKEIEAESQRSAARAQTYLNRPGELYTSTLLAIDSIHRDPSADEGEEILRRNITLLPLPREQFFEQTGKINALVFNPEINMFITGSADGTTCAWKVEEEQVRKSFCTPSVGSAVTAIALSSVTGDNLFLATGDEAGIVRILDPQSGKVIRTFARIEAEGTLVQIAEIDTEDPQSETNPQAGAVRSISVRPTQAQHLVVAFSDGEIPVFDPITGKINSRLSVINRPNVSGISRNGAWLVVGPQSGQVAAWELGTRRRFSTSLHVGGVLAMAFSPTQNIVVTAGSDTIAITNLSTAKEFYRIPIQSPVRDIAFFPNGTRFVTVSEDHRIRVWDTERGNELLSMSQDDVVTEVVVSSKGEWIATTGNDRTARVWDSVTGAEIFQIPLKASGSQLAFVNNDKWLVTTDETGAIAIWDLSVMNLPALSVSASNMVSRVQYSPSGEWLAAASEDKLWLPTPDEETILRESQLGQPIDDLESNIVQLVFSHDSRLLATLTAGNEFIIYNVEERRRQATVKATEKIQSIAFSPDDQVLITGGGDGKLQAWNARTGELLEDQDGFPQGTSLASAGGALAVGSQDQIAILSDDENGSFRTIGITGNPVLLVLSTDGSRLAFSSPSGDITIFQYQDGQLTQSASFRKDLPASLAFNPEGTLLALGSTRNVYLIDVATGNEVARIPHISTVNGVSFSADGKYLVTASAQMLRFWDVENLPQIRTIEDLIETACLDLPEDFDVSNLSALFPEEEYEPVCE